MLIYSHLFTTMPDKIVKKAVFREFGIEADNDMEFIGRMEALARETSCSQTLMCWAIWLKEANVKTSNWENLGSSKY